MVLLGFGIINYCASSSSRSHMVENLLWGELMFLLLLFIRFLFMIDPFHIAVKVAEVELSFNIIISLGQQYRHNL